MSQLKITWIQISLLSAFLSLNACTPTSLLNSEPKSASLPNLALVIPKATPSGLNATPAPVLTEQNVGELPLTQKLEKIAQFLDTSDPEVPFVLFYDATIKQSQIYQESGDALVSYFQALLEKKPGNLELIFDLSSAYLLAGKPEKTLELTKRFTNSSAPPLPALYNQLVALLKMGKRAEIGDITKQLYDHSKKPNAHSQPESLYIYLTEIALRKYPAIAYGMDLNFIQKVFDYQLKSTNNDRFLALALYHRYSNDNKTFFSGSFLPELEKATQLNPNSALYKTAYARELLYQNRFQAAQKLLEEALEMSPHSALTQLTFAQLYQAESKPEELVVQAFEKAQTLAPSWYLPAGQLSDYYFNQKKFKEAANTLKKFLDNITVSINSLYLKLANSLFYAGDYQGAILNYNLYNKSFAFEDLEVTLMRGKAQGLLNTAESRKLAIADFNSVLEKAPKPVVSVTPNISESAYWRALQDRGIAYFQDGQFQKSHDDFAQLLILTPKSDDIKYNLTGALGALGRYEEAIKLGLEIPETYPEIKGVYRNIASASAYSGKCAESEKYAKLAGIPLKSCRPLN